MVYIGTEYWEARPDGPWLLPRGAGARYKWAGLDVGNTSFKGLDMGDYSLWGEWATDHAQEGQNSN
jgi:hypothetical protein